MGLLGETTAVSRNLGFMLFMLFMLFSFNFRTFLLSVWERPHPYGGRDDIWLGGMVGMFDTNIIIYICNTLFSGCWVAMYGDLLD